MSMTDPIADLLTRIRNANTIGSRKVKAPYSALKKSILKILKEQGYIVDYDPQMDGSRGILNIQLKFGPDGEKVIQHIQRVSSPGRRVFMSSKDIPDVLNGLGIAVLSTSRGVMSGQEAKKLGIGGEVLCEVW